MVRAMNLFVPLYIYPNNCYQNPNTTACAWYPLYQQAATYPTLQFTVVVNPASGPGSTACPDVNYIAAIAFLNKYKNIKKLGYVDSAWTKKPVANYTKEIQTYANWAKTTTCNADMHLDGLFVDDMLSTNDTNTKSYYKTWSSVTNSTMGTGRNYLFLNPGNPIDVEFYKYGDMFLTFESYYKNKNATGTVYNSGSTYNNCPRQKQTFCGHDWNGTALQQQQESDTQAETYAMGGFFLTDRVQDDKANPPKNPYDKFPTLWNALTAAVNATNSWMQAHPQWYP